MFSKACEYSIRAIVFVYLKSTEGKARASIKDIAKEIDSPEPFTAKVLQRLTRKGLISSVKGPGGGFFTAPGQEDISLLDIVMAVDGNELLVSCSLGLKDCSEDYPCPVHHEYKIIRKKLIKMLQDNTVKTLSSDLKSGKSHLYNPLSLD